MTEKRRACDVASVWQFIGCGHDCIKDPLTAARGKRARFGLFSRRNEREITFHFPPPPPTRKKVEINKHVYINKVIKQANNKHVYTK